jgi:integrase
MTTWLRKDRKCWVYEFQIEGARYRGRCIHPETGAAARNKREADKIELLIRADALRAPDDQANEQLLLSHAFGAFATRKRSAKNWPNQQNYIRELTRFFGATTPIEEISTQRVWDYIAFARQQPILVYMGAGKRITPDVDRATLFRPCTSGKLRADSTINRYLDCLRETLRIAYEIVDSRGRPRLQGLMPKIPDLDEPEHLPRPISDADIDRIVIEAPLHLAEAVLLARLMGFRKGEMFALTVDQVDLGNRGIWLAAASTKANRAEFIPASGEACELLAWLLGEARQRGVRSLISYRHGKKGEWCGIKNPRRAWRTTLTALGLEGQHVFHNTKASFVTAVANVATTEVTQQLARHKDYRTTQRYIKISDLVARTAVEDAVLKTSISAASPHQESPPEKKHEPFCAPERGR